MLIKPMMISFKDTAFYMFRALTSAVVLTLQGFQVKIVPLLCLFSPQTVGP